MKRRASEPFQPHRKCPHCGGEHWGQRFDDCTYVNIKADPNATEEERRNAAGTLAAHKREALRPPVTQGQ